MVETYRSINEVSREMKINLSIGCLICEEPVLLTEMESSRLNHGLNIDSKICERCKNAILYYRRQFESSNEN